MTKLKTMKLKNNYVLCKLIRKNKDYTTESGIYLFSPHLDQDQFHFDNIDRMFEVIKIPEKIECKKWGTELEIKDGDIVIASAVQSDHCKKIDIDGEEYCLLNYFELRMALREEKKIPLNGFIICEEVFEEKKMISFTKKEVDRKKLKVLYVGKPNTFYAYGKRKTCGDSNEDIKPGDIIIKDVNHHIPLEGNKILKIDNKKHIAIQRRYVDAVLN